MNTQQYFSHFKKEVEKVYALANEARAKGLDPADKVEIPLAMSMAEKVVSLISTIYPQMEGSGIAPRILELEKEYGKLDTTVVFKIAEEVAKQKFCKFRSVLEAIDAGIRVGFAYATLGVVSSPIEGYTGIEVGKTKEGKDYIVANFSGPIRSAGTTASCVVLMLIDFLRESFGYDRYDATDDEAKRYVSELTDFHERINNLQYMPTEEEILFLAKRLPIQISGEKSEKLEVSNYKNLERVNTNYIRSGVCLIFGEGLAQKAAKGFRLLNMVKKNGIKSTGFDFLEDYIKLHEKRDRGKTDSSPIYIKDIVAGRPIFGHPGRSGGFRFRYGRGRVSGFSASSLHPATMGITDNFIATGTQLKIEKPTKGTVVTVCDSIDGPIVKFYNGSVKRLKDKDEAKKVYSEVEEIIYLGDILFPFSDVANRNSQLIKPGYVEEWWVLELKKQGGSCGNPYEVSFEEAIALSEKYKIPLHPKFIFFWTQIEKKMFLELIKWLKWARYEEKIILPFNKYERETFKDGKRALELLGVEHDVFIENVVIKIEESMAFLENLGLTLEPDLLKLGNILLEFEGEEDVLKIVNSLSRFVIKDKAGEFIGARMGRPEKAKLRKLTGSPNALFPVGSEGGRLRSVQAACEEGTIMSSFPLFFCENCKKETIYPLCEDCEKKCKKEFYFFMTKEKSFHKELEGQEKKGSRYCNQSLDINHFFNKAVEKLRLLPNEIPFLVKGVRGVSSENKDVENLAKGLLRARHDLQVNKDGTIRLDVTELPLISFKPKEIFVSVERLRELGYAEDVYGKPLENDEQILELKPHDILLPGSSESPDERADEVFIKIANFVDEELERFYGLPKFHNVKKRDDLVGQFGVCMAPHNCAGVVCRIIGFANALGGFASPYMHAAIRRDCLGYDNYISVKENGRWKIEKIGEFIEKSKPNERVDVFGTLKKRTNGLSTWSNPGEKEVREITKHPPRNLLKIYSEDGRKLELTEDHKVYLKGKEEVRACELREGDKIMVSYKKEIDEKNIEELFLPNFFKDRKDVMLRNVREYLNQFENLNKCSNFWHRDSFPITFVKEFLNKHGKDLEDLPNNVKISIKRDNVTIPTRIPFDEKLLEVIGLYIAEGYMRMNSSEKGFNQVSIANTSKEIKYLIREIFLTHFGLKPSEDHEDHLTFSSRIVYEIFKNVFRLGSNAKDKRISCLFLDLKKQKLAALLRGYFEGGGSVSLSDTRVTCDTISEGLKHDLSFVLSRFGIFAKFYEYSKEPGPKVREFYIRKKRPVPKFKITKIIIPSNFVRNFGEIGFISTKKKNILNALSQKTPKGMIIDFDENYVYPKIVKIENSGEKISYCLNVPLEHNFFSNDILVHNCDGDEMSIMLLSDVLLNFSRAFLPSHRGGTQDAPLVLNAKIDAGEVDEQILDFEFCFEYPLELYENAEKKEHSSKVKIRTARDLLREGGNPFAGFGFTHNTHNINEGVVCSSYKTLATMQDKVNHQMMLVEKLRGVDTADTARLVIERHFIRDMKGNLRNFSVQEFRCVSCNEITRRPPLAGRCPVCKGKLIFTVHEGGIKKYLNPALELSKRYNLSPYVKQNLELIKKVIDNVFGKDLEKQEAISKWF
ncbi:DNA polymerase II large subunit [Candidatus Pacearchaeota archaeon]|nr:DNA polymerase II large subunit [Candidatus Pacearchaeota archaeon]